MTGRQQPGQGHHQEPRRTEAEREHLARQIGAAPRNDGTSHRGLIDTDLVRGACRFIDDCGILGEVTDWRSQEPRGRGGRPIIYEDPDRLVLVLMLILLLTGGSPQIAEMGRIVEHRLDADARACLRLPPTNGGATSRAIYDRLLRAYRRLTDLIDPMTGTTNRRLTRAQTEAIQAARDPAVSETRIRRAHRLMNHLVEASLDLLPEGTLVAWGGDTSFDATPAPIWGKRGQPQRSKDPEDSMSPEFDAGWYHLPDGTLVWAWALHITVTAPDPFNPGRHPILAVAATLDTPNKRNGENAVAMHQSIRERGYPAGLADSDRGYFSAAGAEAFTRPMTALGYTLVGDYKTTQLGIQATSRGVIAVEGWPYCPGMPQELIDATKTYLADRDQETYERRIAQRRNYRFRRKENQAWMCPAQGPGATATCSLRRRKQEGKKTELGMPTHRSLVTVPEPPQHPDACCTNSASVTFPQSFNEKLMQSLQYGSHEWLSVHKPYRAMMEGYNGYAKDTTNEGLGLAANRRVRGFGANATVAALSLAASNIRKIYAWEMKGRPPAMDPKPRRSPGFVQGEAEEQNGPPETRWFEEPPAAEAS